MVVTPAVTSGGKARLALGDKRLAQVLGPTDHHSDDHREDTIMGTDIHMHVEAKLNLRGEDKPLWREVKRTTQIEAGWESKIELRNRWYPGRNYDEFAILADVRNGYAFAGHDTGDRFEPLSEPRGLPDDASFEVIVAAEDFGVDGHSHSWLTLNDLYGPEGYWDKTVKKRGVVTKEVAERFRQTSEPPDMWSAAVSGPGADQYEQIEWEIRYRDHAEHILSKLIPSLEDLIGFDQLGRIHAPWDQRLTPDDIRIVFWFDN